MRLKTLNALLIISFSLLIACNHDLAIEPCLIDVPNQACYCVGLDKKVTQHPLDYCDGHISYSPTDHKTLLDKCKRAAEKPTP